MVVWRVVARAVAMVVAAVVLVVATGVPGARRRGLRAPGRALIPTACLVFHSQKA